MTEEKKKGFFSKLFGGPKSSCCNVQIVEETEGQKKEPEDKEKGNPKTLIQEVQ
jgi:hypothetical protein